MRCGSVGSSSQCFWLVVPLPLRPTSKPKQRPAVPAHFTASNTSNPIAKYIELVGFRVTERSKGHLIVQFGVVNHSEADVGDVKMTINLGTTAAKPGDPPLISFPAQVSSLGPSELKDVTVEVPTKLRVYELPDWQFLKADFQITSPTRMRSLPWWGRSVSLCPMHCGCTHPTRVVRLMTEPMIYNNGIRPA